MACLPEFRQIITKNLNMEESLMGLTRIKSATNALRSTVLTATALATMSATTAFAEEITIATVNNGDMITMQELASSVGRSNG